MESAGKRNGNKDRQKTEKGNDKKRLTKNRGWQAEEARKKQNHGERKKSGEEKRGQAKEPERPEVQKSLCPVCKRCGGCQLLDIPYERQLQKKQRQVEELLKGFCKVYPIQGMEEPFHYRNKVHGAFGYQKGKVISGIYKEGSHQLVAVEQCMLEDKKADEIIGTIRGLLKSFKIKTYDEDTGYGFLRHVLVKRGFATGQIMVVLVTTSPVFPSKNHFVKALREKHPEITTIIQNLNDRQTSMVLGDRENVLYGKGYIEDELCGRVFRVSSRSFYQVNPVQTEKLYTKAMELAGLTGRETVIDAYCGIGTIGIIAAEKAGKVIGVELNQDAVRDGVGNARRNHIDNIQFYHNDASRFMTRMARNGEGADVVFMDPPRAGSTEEFVEAVKVLRPKRVVYVSCNPETMARDLGFFSKKGYKAAEAWPFDMFPHTENTEVVCLLKRAARNV